MSTPISNKENIDYTWKWFEFHAKQRTTMFNYFIVFSALFINAIITLIKSDFAENSPKIIYLLIFIGIIVTMMFYGLDKRNKQLLSLGEDVMVNLERNFLFKEFIAKAKDNNSDKENQILDRHNKPMNSFGFLHRESEEGKKSLLSYITRHSFLIPALHLLLIMTYIIIGILIYKFGIFVDNSN